MAQLSDDCFAHGGRFMTIEAALALLCSRTSCLVTVQDCLLPDARGRTVAANIFAPLSVPPHPNSAVDGYAVAFDDLSPDGVTRLRISGRLAAGQKPAEHYAAGTALRILTGAILPQGFDTVFMQEDCTEDGEAVILPAGLGRGANTRAIGEDITRGELLFTAGHRLRSVDLGLLASVGINSVSVYRPLKIALFSTGNELCDPLQVSAPLAVGKIFDANRYSLTGLLAGRGITVTDLGILPDDLKTITATLKEAATDHDLVMSSGGVSVGEEDHVKRAVQDLGSLHAWRLALKPGRPIAFGQIGTTAFIGIPGNPVAVVVAFLSVVWPFLCHLSGQNFRPPQFERLRVGFSYKKKKNRREWLRVTRQQNGIGGHELVKYPRDGAGVLSSVCFSDGVIELCEDTTDVNAGDHVNFISFQELGL